MKNPASASLETVVQALEDLAPPSLAADWDNTGLLLEPAVPGPIHRILLTLDFTPPVLQEALDTGCELVVAYHPVIFEPLRAITARDPKTAALLGALRSNLAVYCPHTALDAVPGGVTDWLARGLGPGQTRPLVPLDHRPGAGMGRWVDLSEPASLEDLAARLKATLNLSALRVARPRTPRLIRTAAVCPGAGASLLLDHPADLLLTGEMRHHDILAAQGRGAAVVLCEHAQSERGYLPHFAEALRSRLPVELSVAVAQTDEGPLHLL